MKHLLPNRRWARARARVPALRAAALLPVICCLALVPAFGQGIGLGMTAEFPDVGSLFVNPVELRFDLSEEEYPPREFPGYYSPLSDDAGWNGIIVIEVSASSTSWWVEAAFDGLLNTSDNLLLPAGQLQYRVDSDGEGDWQPFSIGTNRLLGGAGTEVNLAVERHALELRLQVTGHEIPGTYAGLLLFTLVSGL